MFVQKQLALVTESFNINIAKKYIENGILFIWNANFCFVCGGSRGQAGGPGRYFKQPKLAKEFTFHFHTQKWMNLFKVFEYCKNVIIAVSFSKNGL